MKPGSICWYTDKCIHFIMTGCDGKDYPDCDYKKELKEQGLKTRRFEVDEIANLYGVPPSMIKEIPESSFKHIDEQKRAINEMIKELRDKDNKFAESEKGH